MVGIPLPEPRYCQSRGSLLCISSCRRSMYYLHLIFFPLILTEEMRPRSQRRRQRDETTEEFLRKSRADLATARRLLDRSPSLSRSGTTEISDVVGGVHGALGSHEEQPPLERRLEAAAIGRCPAPREKNHVGRRAATTEVYGDHQTFREQPKHREGFFYRAALTSHVAFITDTASPSSLRLGGGGGAQPEGECVVEAGVGAASRGLREDVAEVRKVCLSRPKHALFWSRIECSICFNVT